MSDVGGVAVNVLTVCRSVVRRPVVDEGMARRIWGVIQSYPGCETGKVWAGLRYRLGVTINRKQVARIMKLRGWTLRERWNWRMG